jgi:transposase
VKAHRSAHGGKGAKKQAIGLSRGGLTIKIHVMTDVLGRPAVIRLTPCYVSDICIADELIEVVGPVRRVIADRGYDANQLRCTLPSVSTLPIVPGRRSRKRLIRHDERCYRDRWSIEAAFCRLKDFRRVATRYDKLALNFLSAVVLAAIIAFWV